MQSVMDLVLFFGPTSAETKQKNIQSGTAKMQNYKAQVDF